MVAKQWLLRRNVMRLMTQLKPASHGMFILAGVIIFSPAAVAQDGDLDSEALIDKYCAVCHTSIDFAGGVDLEYSTADSIAERPQIGEKMIKRLRAGMMPPVGKARPDYDTVQKLAQTLEEGIDKNAAGKGPHPLAPGLHRLNRTEYTNAIRDLLALDIDAARFLP